MPPSAPALSTPLSEEEYAAFAEFLAAHSPFDADGLLGLLNAIAVAPSLLPPSIWLPVVFSTSSIDQPAEDVQQSLGWLLRLYNEVVATLDSGRVLAPNPENVAACETFAAGYVTGAELDPQWVGNDSWWTFACPLAYLAGERDLVPRTTLEKIELHFAPDTKQMLCRALSEVVLTANEFFKQARKRSLAEADPRNLPGQNAEHVGRNDPCPCGSGKKYKRCCIDRVPEMADEPEG